MKLIIGEHPTTLEPTVTSKELVPSLHNGNEVSPEDSSLPNWDISPIERKRQKRVRTAMHVFRSSAVALGLSRSDIPPPPKSPSDVASTPINAEIMLDTS